MKGKYKLVYICPESAARLAPQLAMLHRTVGISLFAVDEALPNPISACCIILYPPFSCILLHILSHCESLVFILEGALCKQMGPRLPPNIHPGTPSSTLFSYCHHGPLKSHPTLAVTCALIQLANAVRDIEQNGRRIPIVALTATATTRHMFVK